MNELIRPWKLITFSIGFGLLIFGALYTKFSDWDIGVSIIMAVLTYITAPWSIRIIIARRWKYFPLVIFYGWLSVDGSYCAWHSFMGNQMLRDGQWQCSLALWLLCGFIWMWEGSLSDLFKSARKAVIDAHHSLSKL